MTSRLQLALMRMGSALENSWSALGHLTCAEVDTIVSVLIEGGAVLHAPGVLLGHSGTDDDRDCDAHFEIGKALRKGKMDKARRLAEKYVRRMTPDIRH